MKPIFFIFTLLISTLFLKAQTTTVLPPVDKSPLDISYFPKDFPVLKAQGKTKEATPTARIIYSRPQKNGRTVFGELVPYGELWRIGANESTEIEFYKDVQIGGKKLLKGRYTIYCIPNATAWTIIINKDADSWGAFKYEIKKDVLRSTFPITNLTTPVENFTAFFEPSVLGGFNLVFVWDVVRCAINIK
jgi:hypothetical protein